MFLNFLRSTLLRHFKGGREVGGGEELHYRMCSIARKMYILEAAKISPKSCK